MRPSRFPWVVVAVALVFGTAPHAGARPSAQRTAPVAPPPSPASQPSGSGSPVRVSVVVTDRQNNPVTTLKPGDFELRDEGIPQTLDAVELLSARPPGARAIALFLDEYHVSDANAVRARDALTRFVDEALRPDDLVIVMKPLDSLMSIRVAQNRDEVRRAVADFNGRKGDYAPRTPFEATYMSRTPASLEATRAQIVLSGLSALTARLGGMPDDRKAILLVSEGFVRNRSRGATPLPDLPSVIRSANLFDVGISTINPQPDAEPQAAGADGRSPAVPGDNAATLRSLAAETGGASEETTGDLFAGLQRVGRDLDASYRLTYRRSTADDGRFHAIQVHVKRDGVQVETRAGYAAPVNESVRRAQLASQRAHTLTPVVALHPYHQSEFIKPWFGMSRGTDGRTRVTITWEPGARLFTSRPPIVASAIIVTALAADGNRLFSGPLSPVTVGGADAQPSPERAVFDAPPGRIAVEMSIEASDEKVLDTDVRDVSVPNLDASVTVIAEPQVLRARTARQFAAVSEDPDAPPVASREFSRAERLLIRVPAYGPGNTPAVVKAKLLNALGQTMLELPALAGPRDGMTKFDVSLAPFAPGDYRIEFTATSPASEAKEDLSFRITS